MKLTRLPIPRQTPGKIKFRWAKAEGENPDWNSVWCHPADKATNKLVVYRLSELADELVKRGYDPRSIRFECAKLLDP